MTQSIHNQLNSAQELIYSRSNIRRAFTDFDETDICGIHRLDNNIVVVRNDGSEQVLPIEPIHTAYLSFTSRLKQFFSYLGPNYRGPSLWRNNAYVLFKGWNYSHALGHTTIHAQMQKRWADKFTMVDNQEALLSLLQSDQADLGHLIAPDGLMLPAKQVDINSDIDESSTQVPAAEPYCSCGSFKRQLENLAEFQQEITGYQPTCIHMTWFKKYRELLVKRTQVRDACNGTPEKCVAWWYAPPEDSTSKGKFVVLHTKSGAQAPVHHWCTYKPNESFTEDHVWDLFFNMMDAGYVPFPGSSLPQLSSIIKKKKA